MKSLFLGPKSYCIIFLYCISLFFFSCKKKYNEKNINSKNQIPQVPSSVRLKTKTVDEKKTIIENENLSCMPLVTSPDQLDFFVKNKTEKTLFIVAFTYLKRTINSNWSWEKSKVYEVAYNDTVLVDIAEIKDKTDKNDVFGYLGVFDTRDEAEMSVYELLEDSKKIDIDKLSYLSGKTVIIQSEKYGFKKDILNFDFIQNNKSSVDGDDKKIPELDFLVVNNTGQVIYVCYFVYTKNAKGSWKKTEKIEKDDMTVWRFEKTKVMQIQHGETAYIDIGTIATERDRTYAVGYLGVFNEFDKNIAYDSTFELLQAKNKINLGNLERLKRKKIILETEKYGLMGDIINFINKPAGKVDWKKAIRQ